MSTQAFEIAGIQVTPGERRYIQLPVTSLLTGREVRIPLHVIHGSHRGPVLGLISAIHGDEHFPIRILREIVLGLEPERLAGTILAIPVANPIGFARGKRSTPEEDIGSGNMNRIFPGTGARPGFERRDRHSSDHSLTESMAATISQHFLSRLHYLIDFHCHGKEGGLAMMLQTRHVESENAQRAGDLASYFNLGVINENVSQGTITCTGYASSLDVVTVVAEIGGGALPERAQKKAVQLGVNGVLNVLRHLGMLPGESCVEASPQLCAHVRPHVRPTRAGYLITHFDPEDLFQGKSVGIPVEQGDILAEVFDPYTFDMIEQIVSPVDGIVYMTRCSGPVSAGACGYSIADISLATWVD